MTPAPKAAQARPVQAAPAKTMMPAAPAQVEPMQPRVSTPSIHVTPHTEDIFEGSMHTESGEGFDPCHEDELVPAVHPCEMAPAEGAAAAPVTGGLNLRWTGNAMVQAMVMNEVLTRPCDRKR